MPASGRYLTFIQTPHYAAAAKKLLTGEAQRLAELAIMADPRGGKTEAGVHKIRIPLEQRGKRGGARVIYYYVERRDVVYLLDIYAKNVRDALSHAEQNAVRKLVRILEEES